jgi:hypothetical protein
VVSAQCRRFDVGSLHDAPDGGPADGAPPGEGAADQGSPAGETPVGGGPAEVERIVALAAELWDLAGWAARARVLLEALDALVGTLEAGDAGALAPGFVLSAAALRHFQADPLLPDALLPSDWPGEELRRHYDRYDAAYRARLADWFSATP